MCLNKLIPYHWTNIAVLRSLKKKTVSISISFKKYLAVIQRLPKYFCVINHGHFFSKLSFCNYFYNDILIVAIYVNQNFLVSILKLTIITSKIYVLIYYIFCIFNHLICRNYAGKKLISI